MTTSQTRQARSYPEARTLLQSSHHDRLLHELPLNGQLNEANARRLDSVRSLTGLINEAKVKLDVYDFLSTLGQELKAARLDPFHDLGPVAEKMEWLIKFTVEEAYGRKPYCSAQRARHELQWLREEYGQIAQQAKKQLKILKQSDITKGRRLVDGAQKLVEFFGQLPQHLNTSHASD